MISGLRNATEACQYLVNEVTQGLDFCNRYMHHILALSIGKKSTRSTGASSFNDIVKFVFVMPDIFFLGHLVNAHGVQPPLEKVVSILAGSTVTGVTCRTVLRHKHHSTDFSSKTSMESLIFAGFLKLKRPFKKQKTTSRKPLCSPIITVEHHLRRADTRAMTQAYIQCQCSRVSRHTHTCR